MKKSLLSLAVLLLSSSSAFAVVHLEQQPGQPGQPDPSQQQPSAQQSAAATPVDMKDVSYIIGYSIGNQIGSDLKVKNLELNQDEFTTGLDAGLSGKDGKYSETQMNDKMKAFDAQQNPKTDPKQPAATDKVDIKDVSYIIGFSIGKSLTADFKKKDLELNHDELTSGLKTGLSGKPGKYTDAQMTDKMNAFDAQQQKKDQAATPAKSADQVGSDQKGQ